MSFRVYRRHNREKCESKNPTTRDAGVRYQCNLGGKRGRLYSKGRNSPHHLDVRLPVLLLRLRIRCAVGDAQPRMAACRSLLARGFHGCMVQPMSGRNRKAPRLREMTSKCHKANFDAICQAPTSALSRFSAASPSSCRTLRPGRGSASPIAS